MTMGLNERTADINLHTRHPGRIIYVVQAKPKDGENTARPVEERDSTVEYERDDWFEAEADRWL